MGKCLRLQFACLPVRANFIEVYNVKRIKVLKSNDNDILYE